MANPFGAPSTYTEKVLEDIDRYIELSEWDIAPSILDFVCRYPQYRRHNLYEWEKAVDKENKLKYPKLSYMLEKLRNNSLNIMLQGSLKKDFDYRTTALMASKDHNYEAPDKLDMTSNGQKIDPLTALLASIFLKQEPVIKPNDK